MAPKIPDRWIPYKACGDVIEGTRIVCFKVPLNKNVQAIPEITQIWDVPAVIAKIPKLGAVIDLTNTARYYNPREFESAGVLHRKILMPGREIPPENKVQEFMDAVDEFLGKDCDTIIGVHCTHGLNRTGYMVCRYMKDRLKIPAEEAIKRFEKARGYEIERQNYLASLLDKELPSPDFDENKNHEIEEYENQREEDYSSPPGKLYESQHSRGKKRKRQENDGSQYIKKTREPEEPVDNHLSRRNRYACLSSNDRSSNNHKQQFKKNNYDRAKPQESQSRNASQVHHGKKKKKKFYYH